MSKLQSDERQREKNLEELKTPIQFIKGVGPARAEMLGRLGLRTAMDVLFFFPRRYEDYSRLLPISELESDELASVEGVIEEVDQSSSTTGRHVTYVLLKQKTEKAVHFLRAMWFNQSFMYRKFKSGQKVVFKGKPRKNGMRWEMVHPRVTFLGTEDQPAKGQIIPVYRLVEGLNQFRIRTLVNQVVEKYADLVEDVLPESFQKEKSVGSIRDAIHWIHEPPDQESLDNARERLVYQELFVLQLALAMRRFRVRDLARARELPADAKIQARILRRIPFELSSSQQKAIEEISADMAKRYPMNRLLHGDVGSGKTVVAFYAALLAVAHGHQAVIMAPTEILARQHLRTLQGFLKASRVRTRLWSGSLNASQRKEIAAETMEGRVDILIGTQAIVQSSLEFNSLAVVIVDEQHKFGVKQRARLRQASIDPHYLVMTATPIPRTIAMTAFGDLDVTTLEKDPERAQPIHTYLGEAERRESWWDFFRKKLLEGRQGYVVAPLVDGEGDPSGGYASAEQLYESLVNGPLADFRVDIVHGRQTAEEKDHAIQAFARGNTQVLVATTVIEVGIDVPNATMMTIESAQRFGLSQLHQLRGRVGRGGLPGYVCVFADLENPQTRERIEAFVENDDGFDLAEKDLELRGPGNFFGTQQHGMPPMRIADLVKDSKLLERSRADAQLLIDVDPELGQTGFAALRKMVLARYGHTLELSDVG